MKHLSTIFFTALFIGCQPDMPKNNANQIHQYSYELGVIGGFSELIAAEVKQLALSAPMSPEEMDAFIVEGKKVAAKYSVSVFRESNLIITNLFQPTLLRGKMFFYSSREIPKMPISS